MSEVTFYLKQITDRDLNALVDPDNDGADNAIPGVDDEGERDSHGTSCAGIIAMEKSNDVCGVGVAYLSRIIGEYCNNN